MVYLGLRQKNLGDRHFSLASDSRGVANLTGALIVIVIVLACIVLINVVRGYTVRTGEEVGAAVHLAVTGAGTGTRGASAVTAGSAEMAPPAPGTAAKADESKVAGAALVADLIARQDEIAGPRGSTVLGRVVAKGSKETPQELLARTPLAELETGSLATQASANLAAAAVLSKSAASVIAPRAAPAALEAAKGVISSLGTTRKFFEAMKKAGRPLSAEEMRAFDNKVAERFVKAKEAALRDGKTVPTTKQITETVAKETYDVDLGYSKVAVGDEQSKALGIAAE